MQVALSIKKQSDKFSLIDKLFYLLQLDRSRATEFKGSRIWFQLRLCINSCTKLILVDSRQRKSVIVCWFSSAISNRASSILRHCGRKYIS